MTQRGSTKQLLSAFDLDHTLLSANSSFRFGLYLYNKKHLSFSSLLFILTTAFSYNMGVLSLERLHEKAFQHLFLKKPERVVKKWVADFLSEHLNNLLYMPAIQELKKAQAEGHLTALLSSSPSFLVEPIAILLNIPLWEASCYDVDSFGCYSAISKLNFGVDKALKLNMLRDLYAISLDKTYAYSDSHLDLPFLLAAGNVIVVNPTRLLRRLANKNKWSII